MKKLTILLFVAMAMISTVFRTREIYADEPVTLSAGWFDGMPTASWDAGPNEIKEYKVKVVFDNGEAAPPSDTVTVSYKGYAPTNDFSTFVKNNGSGNYHFEVTAYNGEKVVAQGRSETACFHKVTISIDEPHAWVMFGLGDSSSHVEDGYEGYYSTGTAKVEITSVDYGWKLTGISINGSQVTTDTVYQFDLNADTPVKVTVEQNPNMIPVSLELGEKGKACGEELVTYLNSRLANANAVLSGSLISFNVYDDITIEDLIDEIEDIWDDYDLQIENVEGFSGMVGLKEMSDYASDEEIDEDHEKTDTVSSNQKFYVLWTQSVDTIELDIKPAICGKIQTAEQSLDTHETRIVNGPVVTFKDIKLVPFMCMWQISSGTPFIGDEKYNAYIIIPLGIRYHFSDNTTIKLTVDGKKPESDVECELEIDTSAGGLYLYIRNVKAVHDWGEWQTIKEATETEKGLKRRICKANSDHFEEAEIPAKGRQSDGSRYAIPKTGV